MTTEKLTKLEAALIAKNLRIVVETLDAVGLSFTDMVGQLKVCFDNVQKSKMSAADQEMARLKKVIAGQLSSDTTLKELQSTGVKTETVKQDLVRMIPVGK
jgi:hypothetical protein